MNIFSTFFVIFYVVILVQNTPIVENPLSDIFINIPDYHTIFNVTIPASTFQSPSDDVMRLSVSSDLPDFLSTDTYPVDLLGQKRGFGTWWISVSDGYLFSASKYIYEEILIFNVSNIESCTLVGNVSIGYPVDAIFVNNNHAYAVVEDEMRIFVVDVSDKTAPFVVSEYEFLDLTYVYATAMIFIDDEIAILAVWNDGLFFFNITNKENIELFSWESIEEVESMLIRGDRLFVARGSNGLSVYDISDLLNIRHLGTVQDGSNNNGVCSCSDSILYVCDVSNSLIVYDITTNYTHPQMIASEAIGPIINCDCSDDNPDFVGVSGFVGSSVVDVSTPSDPENLLTMNYMLGSRLAFVDIDKTGRLFLAVDDIYRSFRIVDITVDGPVELEVFMCINYNHIFIKDDLAYVCNGEDGVLIFEIDHILESHIGRISNISSFACFSYVDDDDYLYLVDGGGMSIYDLNSPTPNSYISRVEILAGQTGDIVKKGDYVYISSSYYGLNIVDVSNILNPKAESRYDTSLATGLYVREDSEIVYLIDRNNGLYTFDVTDKSLPDLLWLFETEYITCFVVDEETNIGYLIVEGSGLVILDVTDPSDGFFVMSNLEEPNNDLILSGIVLPGSFAFSISSFESELYAIDISNPYEPFLMSNEPLSLDLSWLFGAVGFASVGNRVFITACQFGIFEIGFGSLELQIAAYEVQCGSTDIEVKATDSTGSAFDTFEIEFEFMCEGTAFCENFTCVCPSGYVGDLCEIYTCDDIPFDEYSEVCSGFGNCTSRDECSCVYGRDGDYCELWMCDEIPANDRTVCGGHGDCSEIDVCQCFSGYSSVEPFGPCTEYYCGVEFRDSDLVCNGHGTCEASHECDCDHGYKGDLCEQWECGGYDNDEESVCNKKGTCISPEVCDCNSNWGGERCTTNKLLGSVMTPILLIFFCSCFCCCFVIVCWAVIMGGLLVTLFLLTLISGLLGTVGYVLKQRLGLERFSKLKNVDLLLREQELEEDDSIAHLKIDQKLFEIPFEEIKIESRLGEGGSSSVVFKSLWLGRAVAFKCFKTRLVCTNQDIFDEFEREVRVMANLSHPNVIRFFGATLNPPRVGIIMEFCSKGELLDFFRVYSEENTGEVYPLEEKVRMIMEISSSLKYLHARNVIHRDLKPENVLVDEKNQTKLMDFGLSKLSQSLSQEKTTRVGTCIYMAPEVLLSTEYDEKCDVFSFGILIWVMITENPLPYGKNEERVEFKVAQSPNYRPDVKDVEDVLARTKNKKVYQFLIDLMKQSWNGDPKKRSSFWDIFRMLERTIEIIRNKEVDELTEEDFSFIDRFLPKEGGDKMSEEEGKRLLEDMKKEMKQENEKLKEELGLIKKEVERRKEFTKEKESLRKKKETKEEMLLKYKKM